jgi:hypothetical protein
MGDLLYVCPALTACLVGAFDKSAVSRVRLSDIVGLAGCLSDRAGGMPLVLSVSLSLAGTAWLAMLHSCVFLFIAPRLSCVSPGDAFTLCLLSCL